MFRPGASDETNLAGDETISCFGADIPKQQIVIKRATERPTALPTTPGDDQMQTLTFMLAAAFMIVFPALAGNSESARQGIGPFPYNGSPMAVSQPIVVAAR